MIVLFLGKQGHSIFHENLLIPILKSFAYRCFNPNICGNAAKNNCINPSSAQLEVRFCSEKGSLLIAAFFVKKIKNVNLSEIKDAV
jgi:hypothetical protein